MEHLGKLHARSKTYQAFQINVIVVFHIIFLQFSIHERIGAKLLTRLQLKFNHLGNLKLRH